jgi:hypothetical protein
MNEKSLLNYIGEIDDKYIDEIEGIKAVKVRKSFNMYALTAAMVTLVVAAGGVFGFMAWNDNRGTLLPSETTPAVTGNGTTGAESGTTEVRIPAYPFERDWVSLYYRSGSVGMDSDFVTVRSVEEAREYFTDNYAVSDDDYFAPEFYDSRFLVLVDAIEGTGSARHNVESVTEKDGVLYVNINRHNPFIGTTDMAHWLIIVEVCKSYAELEIEVVWTVIEYDETLLQIPADKLRSVNFGERLLTVSFRPGALFVTFEFDGIQGRQELIGLESLTLTRDGVESEYWYEWDLSEATVWRNRLNSTTTYHFFLSSFIMLPGTYVLSGTFHGVPFETEAHRLDNFHTPVDVFIDRISHHRFAHVEYPDELIFSVDSEYAKHITDEGWITTIINAFHSFDTEPIGGVHSEQGLAKVSVWNGDSNLVNWVGEDKFWTHRRTWDSASESWVNWWRYSDERFVPALVQLYEQYDAEEVRLPEGGLFGEGVLF